MRLLKSYRTAYKKVNISNKTSVDVLYNKASIRLIATLIKGRRNKWQQLLNDKLMGVLDGISAIFPSNAIETFNQMSGSGIIICPTKQGI